MHLWYIQRDSQNPYDHLYLENVFLVNYYENVSVSLILASFMISIVNWFSKW